MEKNEKGIWEKLVVMRQGVEIVTSDHAAYLIPDDRYIMVKPTVCFVNTKTYEKIRQLELGPEFDEYINNTLKKWNGDET
jgi:hypothetical protein